MKGDKTAAGAAHKKKKLLKFFEGCRCLFEQDPTQERVMIPYPDWREFWKVCCTEHGYDDDDMERWVRYTRRQRTIKMQNRRKRERERRMLERDSDYSDSEAMSNVSTGDEGELEDGHDRPKRPPFSYPYFRKVPTLHFA